MIEAYAKAEGWAAVMTPALPAGETFLWSGVTWEVVGRFKLPCCGELATLVRRKGSRLWTWSGIQCERHPEAGSWTVEGPVGMPVQLSAKAKRALGSKDPVEPYPMHLLEPFRERALKNHGQTLERLAERGGMAPSEILALIEDRPWRDVDDADALRALTAYMVARL